MAAVESAEDFASCNAATPASIATIDSAVPIFSWHTHTYSPQGATFIPKFELDLPASGVVFLEPPEDARVHAQMLNIDPVYDYPLRGTFTMTLPSGSPRLRFKSVRIGFIALSKLDFGRKGIETDELFRTEVETSDEDVLEDELKFDFTIMIPSTLAPRDWHPNPGSKGHVANTLYARVEGEPLGRSRSPGPARSRSRSPPPLSNLIAHASSFIAPSQKQLPRPPEYTQSDQPTQWLQGTHRAERSIRLVHNPNPTGGVNVLDDRSMGEIKGLGAYNLRLYSDVWTISTMLKANFVLSDIPPETTVFCFRVSLVQDHLLKSPRDGKTLTTKSRVLMLEKGVKPDARQDFPPVKAPALWRGRAAGGKDDLVLMIDLLERVLPEDWGVRPSTLQGIITPLQVNHSIETAIYFSFHGQDAYGKALRYGGPGALRVMTVKRPVFLPCCALIPSTVKLPDYEHPEESRLPKHPDHPWKVCACSLPTEVIRDRILRAIDQEARDDVETQNAASTKARAERQ